MYECSFYSSTLENHPEVCHIAKVSLEQSGRPVCMTCSLGNSCRFNEAHFNEPSTYLVLECKGYEVPRTEIRNAQTNELIEEIESNDKLYNLLKTKHIPKYDKLSVPLSTNQGNFN